MAGDTIATSGNDGWQHERVEVMSQLAVLNRAMARVEAQLEKVAECMTRYGQQHAMDEARREVVREMFEQVERMQRATPEKLRERLEELEKLKPLGRAALWAVGVIGALLLSLLWGMMTGQVVVAFK